MKLAKIYFKIIFPIFALVVSLWASLSFPMLTSYSVAAVIISIIATAGVYIYDDYETLKKDFKLQKEEIKKFNEKLKIYERINKLEVKMEMNKK